MKIPLIFNEKPIEVNVPPHLRLSVLLDQLSQQPSSYFSCQNGRCGKCLVELDGALVYACLNTAFEVRNQSVKKSKTLADSHWLGQFSWARAITGAPLCLNCYEARLLSVIHYIEKSSTTQEDLNDYVELVQCRCTSYDRVKKLFIFMQRMRERYAK